MAKLPKFKNERELGEFFDTHDSTEYFKELPEETAPIEMAMPRKEPIAIRKVHPTIEKARQVAKKRNRL